MHFSTVSLTPIFLLFSDTVASPPNMLQIRSLLNTDNLIFYCEKIHSTATQYCFMHLKSIWIIEPGRLPLAFLF